MTTADTAKVTAFRANTAPGPTVPTSAPPASGPRTRAALPAVASVRWPTKVVGAGDGGDRRRRSGPERGVRRRREQHGEDERRGRPRRQHEHPAGRPGELGGHHEPLAVDPIGEPPRDRSDEADDPDGGHQGRRDPGGRSRLLVDAVSQGDLRSLRTGGRREAGAARRRMGRLASTALPPRLAPAATSAAQRSRSSDGSSWWRRRAWRSWGRWPAARSSGPRTARTTGDRAWASPASRRASVATRATAGRRRWS